MKLCLKLGFANYKLLQMHMCKNCLTQERLYLLSAYLAWRADSSISLFDQTSFTCVYDN